MAKDPAILWYYNDYLSGTEEMTFEEQGAYMRLLCKQADKGRMSEEFIRRILKEDFDRLWPHIKIKFQEDEKGWFFNARIETEKQKRQNFVDRQVEHGKKGGRPPKGQKVAENNPKETRPFLKSKAKRNPTPKPNESMRVENENRDVNENENEISGSEGTGEKPVNSTPKPDLHMPFTSESFRELWQNWREYRKGEFRKSYKTLQAEQAVLNHLVQLSDGREDIAKEIVLQSMANTWQGLFELKNQQNGKSKQSASPDLSELRDLHAQRYGNG